MSHFVTFCRVLALLSPAFGRAPAPRMGRRVKTLLLLYLFFTVLRFFAGQVFKEQRGSPDGAPARQRPRQREWEHRQHLSRICTMPGNKARENVVYVATGYKVDVVGREGGGAGGKELGAGPP